MELNKGGGRIDFHIGMPPLAPTYKILCRYLFFEGQCVPVCTYVQLCLCVDATISNRWTRRDAESKSRAFAPAAASVPIL